MRSIRSFNSCSFISLLTQAILKTLKKSNEDFKPVSAGKAIIFAWQLFRGSFPGNKFEWEGLDKYAHFPQPDACCTRFRFEITPTPTVKYLKGALLVSVFIIVGTLPVAAESQESDWPFLESAIRASQAAIDESGMCKCLNVKIGLVVFLYAIIETFPIVGKIQEADWPVIEAAIRYSQVVRAQNGASEWALNIAVGFSSASDDTDPPAAFFERFSDVDYAVISNSQRLQREDVFGRFHVAKIVYPTYTKAILDCSLGGFPGHPEFIEYELEFSSGKWTVVHQRNPYEIFDY